MSKQPRVIKVINRNVIETQSFSEEHNDEKRQVSETALLDMRPLLLYTLGPDRRTTVVAQIAREQGAGPSATSCDSTPACVSLHSAVVSHQEGCSLFTCYEMVSGPRDP
jgi:hypothetical protein